MATYTRWKRSHKFPDKWEVWESNDGVNWTLVGWKDD